MTNHWRYGIVRQIYVPITVTNDRAYAIKKRLVETLKDVPCFTAPHAFIISRDTDNFRASFSADVPAPDPYTALMGAKAYMDGIEHQIFVVEFPELSERMHVAETVQNRLIKISFAFED